MQVLSTAYNCAKRKMKIYMVQCENMKGYHVLCVCGKLQITVKLSKCKLLNFVTHENIVCQLLFKIIFCFF